MTVEEFLAGMAARYQAQPEYLWAKFPDNAVFRHPGSKKWFCALITQLPAHKLGLAQQGKVDIIDVKARPELVGGLRSLPGILPGYHMNKEHWISLLLAEVADETVWQLLADSFELTR